MADQVPTQARTGTEMRVGTLGVGVGVQGRLHGVGVSELDVTG